jgi:RNA polymerase sigma factor (sigma-70 family)
MQRGKQRCRVNTAANDPKMAGALMAQYGGAIRRFLERRVRDRADVDDLTQLVFERLLKRAELTSITNTQGYLFQIAANLLAERSRSAVRRKLVIQEENVTDIPEPAEELTPERILLGREACERIVAALQELPARVRAVFVLSRFEEMKAHEIAARLGVSISTVEHDMQRAIRHLKDAIR